MKEDLNLLRSLMIFAFGLLTLNIAAAADVSSSSIGSNEITGPIFPGTDPSPTNSCPKNDSLVILSFGSNFYETSHFPHTVLETSDGPQIVLDRTIDKGLFVTANFTNLNGKMIAKLNRNHFTVFMKYSPMLSIPDHHSLVVTAPDGTVILDVRYLNENAIILEGHMTFRDLDIVATRQSTLINHSDINLEGNCIIDSRGSDLRLAN